MIYIKKSVLCFVNNSKNGENISLFHNYFKKRTEIHQINTRNRNNLVVTRSKIEMGKITYTISEPLNGIIYQIN